MTSPARLRLDFPGELPNMGLSINSIRRGGHWSHHAKLARAERDRWGKAIRLLSPWPIPDIPQPPLRLTVEVRWPTRGIRDPEAVLQALKPCIDALQDWAIIPGDDHRYIVELVVRSIPGLRQVHFGTAIILEEVMR